MDIVKDEMNVEFASYFALLGFSEYMCQYGFDAVIFRRKRLNGIDEMVN